VSDAPKGVRLDSALHEYLVAHGTPPDPIQRQLIEETRREAGAWAKMQIAPEQGALMTVLVRAIGARRAVEIGTFTGYSALCIARGLPEDGRLLCCDVNEEWTGIAQSFWKKAGVAHKIDLRLAPALETLGALAEEPCFDVAFVDADKPAYLDYYQALLPRVFDGGLILVDNVLWGGRVADPADRDPQTAAIRRFNDYVAGDPRVDCVMLPISDGLTLLRKKASR
jgi:caffeoyl-CoA O-methyltransferase